MKLSNYSLSDLVKLVKLALPVIATSFLSMAYNFINIIFVGRLGSDAVAAVGSAGFFMNMSWGISTLLTVGAGIKVSHAVGENNELQARSYVRSGVEAVFILSLLYFVIVVLGRNYLIGIVGINNAEIEHSASVYLLIIGFSIPFTFQNLFFTNVLVGYGDSKSAFSINACTFVLNMALDPLLIFELGLGINGAAIGTILSQAVATFLFYKKINRMKALRPTGVLVEKSFVKQIVALGISPTIQRVSFTLIAIMMARIISQWGPAAIAVQKVGVQIEAISYMTAGGFMSALASVSGKAYGAKKYGEQWSFFRLGIILAFSIGIVTSAILIVFPQALFSVFLHEKESILMGTTYLRIIGFSQLFICMEMMATGAFFGWGRTNIPAITGIALTLLRIPMALLFIHYWSNSLSSVWWSISLSSIAKGSILVLLYIILFKSFIKKHHSIKL